MVSEPRHVFLLYLQMELKNRVVMLSAQQTRRVHEGTRRVQGKMHPTRRVCSCTRRVGPPDSIFSSFGAGIGLESLPLTVLGL